MRLICLFAALLLAACSSQPQQPATYLLRSEVASTSGQQLAASRVALAQVRVAAYIEQPGLVLATGEGRIQAARNHLWAEPLRVSLPRFMANEISAASGRDVSASPLPTTEVRINLAIDQLHGNGKGAALLVAYWDIESADTLNAFRFAEQHALEGDGYGALVQAEEALLRQLAAAIAASLEPTR